MSRGISRSYSPWHTGQIIAWHVGQSNRVSKESHATGSRLLAKNLVVLRMASDPKPKEPFQDFNGQRPIVETDSDRPVSANFLEV
jgi:hypothetical protein